MLPLYGLGDSGEDGHDPHDAQNPRLYVLTPEDAYPNANWGRYHLAVKSLDLMHLLASFGPPFGPRLREG